MVHYRAIGSLNWHMAGVTRGQIACLILLCAGFWMATPGSMYSQQSPTEYQVKAAFLFNFLKFVEWPEDSSSDSNQRWVIGVVGENPFGDNLDQVILGKIVQGHELQVRTFQPTDDLRPCHILFISASEKKRLPSILTTLKGASVLTVADMQQFTESGGMIQFVEEDGRVRFFINVGATSGARLKVSSKLLSLAQQVTGTERSSKN